MDDIGPLAGQVFYIMDRDISQMVSLVRFRGFMSAADFMRTQAVKFFVTDERGKAEVKDLKIGTYYICGVSEQNDSAWNVWVQLKPGNNNLRLDDSNMTAKQKV